MITINKNNSNTVILTLQEKCLLANPYFLFQFKNVQTNTSQYFLPADISTQKERYNEFIIVETATPTTAQISLTIGDYEYTIYEQVGNSNTNPTGLNVVEVGYATCFDLTKITFKEYQGGAITNKVYNG
jgi:hypothetical protein